MSEMFETLMHANLLEVFGERDEAKRRAAVERTYTENVSFADPDEMVIGREALQAKAGRILDGAPGFVFAPDGPVRENHDMGYLAWAFGPEGEPPVVRGVDICFVEDGLISKVYTLIVQ